MPVLFGVGLLVGSHTIAGNRLHYENVGLNGRLLGQSSVLVALNTLALHPALKGIPPRTILRTETSRVGKAVDVLAPANVALIFIALGPRANESGFRCRHVVGG